MAARLPRNSSYLYFNTPDVLTPSSNTLTGKLLIKLSQSNFNKVPFSKQNSKVGTVFKRCVFIPILLTATALDVIICLLKTAIIIRYSPAQRKDHAKDCLSTLIAPAYALASLAAKFPKFRQPTRFGAGSPAVQVPQSRLTSQYSSITSQSEFDALVAQATPKELIQLYHKCATNKDVRGCTQILGTGQCTVDARNSSGATALLKTQVNARNNCTAYLLQAGANPNAQDKFGRTAIGMALGYADFQTLQQNPTVQNIRDLKKANANLHALDQDGIPPIIYFLAGFQQKLDGQMYLLEKIFTGRTGHDRLLNPIYTDVLKEMIDPNNRPYNIADLQTFKNWLHQAIQVLKSNDSSQFAAFMTQSDKTNMFIKVTVLSFNGNYALQQHDFTALQKRFSGVISLLNTNAQFLGITRSLLLPEPPPPARQGVSFNQYGHQINLLNAVMSHRSLKLIIPQGFDVNFIVPKDIHGGSLIGMALLGPDLNSQHPYSCDEAIEELISLGVKITTKDFDDFIAWASNTSKELQQLAPLKPYHQPFHDSVLAYPNNPLVQHAYMQLCSTLSHQKFIHRNGLIRALDDFANTKGPKIGMRMADITLMMNARATGSVTTPSAPPQPVASAPVPKVDSTVFAENLIRACEDGKPLMMPLNYNVNMVTPEGRSLIATALLGPAFLCNPCAINHTIQEVLGLGCRFDIQDIYGFKAWAEELHREIEPLPLNECLEAYYRVTAQYEKHNLLVKHTHAQLKAGFRLSFNEDWDKTRFLNGLTDISNRKYNVLIENIKQLKSWGAIDTNPARR